MSEKEVSRFGVSMPEELMTQFDRYIEQKGYSNRSEALRDLIRKALLEPGQLQVDQMVAGTIVMVYDHHASDLPGDLTELQHHYHQDIVSTMHIHLNIKQCLEIIVVRGLLSRLRELHLLIQTRKCVVYAELSVTYMDGDGKHEHEHYNHFKYCVFVDWLIDINPQISLGNKMINNWQNKKGVISRYKTLRQFINGGLSNHT